MVRPWPVYGPTCATRSPPVLEGGQHPTGSVWRTTLLSGRWVADPGRSTALWTTCSGRGPQWTLVLTRTPLLPNHLQSVTWEEAPLKGESPEARSGHTLTVVDTKAYQLGGTGRKDGKCPI